MSDNTFYADQYLSFTPTQIDKMGIYNYSWTHSINYYREMFFEFHGHNAIEEDFYDWFAHFKTGDWQSDIFTMTDDEFKYHWPSHAAHMRSFPQ